MMLAEQQPGNVEVPGELADLFTEQCFLEQLFLQP
jgi:hypothetical protein